MRRVRSERGAAAVELVGMLPLLLLVAVLAWQALLVTSTVTATEHAARNAGRAWSMGDDAEAAGRDALPGWLRDGATVRSRGAAGVTVRVAVPVVVPGVTLPRWTVARDATMPRIGGS